MPRELRADLIRLEKHAAKQREVDLKENSVQKSQKKRKPITSPTDGDDEVYTSVRFCATKPAAEESEDLTARELAKVPQPLRHMHSFSNTRAVH